MFRIKSNFKISVFSVSIPLIHFSVWTTHLAPNGFQRVFTLKLHPFLCGCQRAREHKTWRRHERGESLMKQGSKHLLSSEETNHIWNTYRCLYWTYRKQNKKNVYYRTRFSGINNKMIFKSLKTSGGNDGVSSLEVFDRRGNWFRSSSLLGFRSVNLTPPPAPPESFPGRGRTAEGGKNKGCKLQKQWDDGDGVSGEKCGTQVNPDTLWTEGETNRRKLCSCGNSQTNWPRY